MRPRTSGSLRRSPPPPKRTPRNSRLCGSGAVQSPHCMLMRAVCRLQRAGLTAGRVCSAEAAEAQSQSRQKQVGALEGRLKAVEKEHGVLSELNRSLISNQQAWKDKVAAAEQHSAGKDAEVKVCSRCVSGRVVQGRRVVVLLLRRTCARGARLRSVHQQLVFQIACTEGLPTVVLDPHYLQPAMRPRTQDLREQVRDLMVYLEAAQMAGADGEMAGGTAQVGAAKPKRRTARR